MEREIEPAEYMIGENGRLTFVFVTDTPWEGKPTLKFTLAGPGARLDFFAMIVGKDGGRYDFSSEIIHSAERTTSRQMIKTAMYDSSSTDFTGNTVIHKDAALSDAYLSHRALLLSPRARSNALPSMEIMADEVKAGHASSTGKPDKDALFYLQSRGIPEARANALLVEAFFMEFAEKIPVGKEKETMLKWLKKIIP